MDRGYGYGIYPNDATIDFDTLAEKVREYGTPDMKKALKETFRDPNKRWDDFFAEAIPDDCMGYNIYEVGNDDANAKVCMALLCKNFLALHNVDADVLYDCNFLYVPVDFPKNENTKRRLPTIELLDDMFDEIPGEITGIDGCDAGYQTLDDD